MTNEFWKQYDASSRGYLERARLRMQEHTPESRVYAALDLRSGIEARYREYLEVWDHISKGAKNGWQLSALWKETERAFKTGDKVVEVTIATQDRHQVRGIIYHTPIPNALRKRGEKLGEFIHSVRSGSSRNPEWWAKLERELASCAQQLAIANMGILLGPPLKRGNQILTSIEIPPGYEPEEVKALISGDGEHVMMNFQYCDSLPAPLPDHAIIWDMQV